jgi:hypothetical protein
MSKSFDPLHCSENKDIRNVEVEYGLKTNRIMRIANYETKKEAKRTREIFYKLFVFRSFHSPRRFPMKRFEIRDSFWKKIFVKLFPVIEKFINFCYTICCNMHSVGGENLMFLMVEMHLIFTNLEIRK